MTDPHRYWMDTALVAMGRLRELDSELIVLNKRIKELEDVCVAQLQRLKEFEDKLINGNNDFTNMEKSHERF